MVLKSTVKWQIINESNRYECRTLKSNLLFIFVGWLICVNEFGAIATSNRDYLIKQMENIGEARQRDAALVDL